MNEFLLVPICVILHTMDVVFTLLILNNKRKFIKGEINFQREVVRKYGYKRGAVLSYMISVCLMTVAAISLYLFNLHEYLWLFTGILTCMAYINLRMYLEMKGHGNN